LCARCEAASLHDKVYREALLLMTVLFAGAACEELPEPKSCWSEERCREQAKL
jgi:hypothetical protein